MDVGGASPLSLKCLRINLLRSCSCYSQSVSSWCEVAELSLLTELSGSDLTLVNRISSLSLSILNDLPEATSSSSLYKSFSVDMSFSRLGLPLRLMEEMVLYSSVCSVSRVSYFFPYRSVFISFSIVRADEDNNACCWRPTGCMMLLTGEPITRLTSLPFLPLDLLRLGLRLFLLLFLDLDFDMLGMSYL